MKEILNLFRSSLVWAAAALVLGIACLLVLTEEEQGGAERLEVFRVDPALVKKMTLSFPGQDRKPMELSCVAKHAWIMKKPVQDVADYLVAERIAGYFCTLVSPKWWAEDTLEAKDMGEVKVRIETVFRDGATEWVEVGNVTASGFRVYGRASSQPGKVLELTKAIWDAIDRPLSEYRKRTLFDVDFFDLDTLTVEDSGRGETSVYQVVDEKSWKVIKPYQAPGNAEALYQFGFDLDRIHIETFLDPNTPVSSLGLDPPAYTITFQSKDGHKSQVAIGVRGEGEDRVWTAKAMGRGVLGQLLSPDKLAVTFDFRDSFRFRQRKILAGLSPMVKSVSVKGTWKKEDNISFKVERLKGTKKWQITEPQRQDVDPVKWEQWFLGEMFGPLNVERFVDEAPTGKTLKERYGLDPPGITVTIVTAPLQGEPAGDKVRSVLLGKADPKQGICFARLDGKGPVIGLPLKFLDCFKYGYLPYLERELIPEINDDSVLEFRAKDQKGEVIWKRGEGGQVWMTIQPEGKGAADEHLMDATLKHGFAKPGKWVKSAPFDPADYGLDKPMLTLTFIYDRNTVEAKAVLYISPTGLTGDSFYARFEKGNLDKGDLVFLLDKSAIDNVRRLMKMARK